MEASSPDHELEDVQQGEEEHRRSANESGPSVPNEGAPHTPQPNPTEGMETPDKELDMTNLTKVLLAGTGKKSKIASPGKQQMCAGLKEEQTVVQKERSKKHQELSDLRKREKGIRRVQQKLAKTVKKMTMAELVAAASMKGMSSSDFKCLDGGSASSSDVLAGAAAAPALSNSTG